MSGKEIIVSTLASIIIISVAGYAVLPALYPVLKETNTTPDVDIDTDLEIILQSKYIEVATQAGILDDQNASYIKIPDTEINITISANSRIMAVFNSPFLLGVGSGITNTRYSFNVSLNVEGVGNRTTRLASYDSGTTSSFYEYSSTLDINFQTGLLPAGTYTINVKYKSNYKDANLAYLTLNVPTVNYTRSLWVMEMR